ncbi:hypothetical protein [Ralstonia wenshanensis]|uniref:Uncharacterized protein n=1 Tax=Ralstonia wenshanensis TaxID=2842456 RepID=A0AAD2B735_9RALS|nr:hypothetical protein [Ralstonia wenshanensis]CAJ0700995.1 hypothetical protein LMG18091_03325 [Ralstonia wenshanensis]
MGKTDNSDEYVGLDAFPGPIPFDVKPADFAWQPEGEWLDELDDGHSMVVDRLIPELERQAAVRLRHEWSRGSRKNYPSPNDDYEQWRDWWLKEVSQYRAAGDAAVERGAPLSAVGEAAVNIFVVASHLRFAIAQKQAEKASVLGMALLAESLLGGYALVCSAAMEQASAMRSSRYAAFKNGAGKANDDLVMAKIYAEAEAKHVWERDSTLRIGEVAKSVIKGLELSKKVFSEDFDIPDEPTVKKWIREAGKRGKLEMPDGAQRAGRPLRKK